MTWFQVIAGHSIRWSLAQPVASSRKRSTALGARAAIAAALAGFLALGPAPAALAQSPSTSQEPQSPSATPPQVPAKNTPSQVPASTSVPPSSPIPISLGESKYDFSRPPRPFPNLIKPYEQIRIAPPDLVNSPRIDQLIQDGKLEVSLQDAVELALENSLDIAVQRYVPWEASEGIMRAKSGATGFNVPGAQLPFSTAAILPLSFFPPFFDPIISSTDLIDDRTIAVNNPFISGTGTATAGSLVVHTTEFNNQYQQAFYTGTSVSVGWINTRSSSNSAFNFFNPNIASSLTVTLSQQLLNGFGNAVNTRNIVIAKNNKKIADLFFEQQAITTVTNTITAYWELVYARQAVKVEEQAVAVSEKLYNDNRKQLEIGTMAPLDVTRANAQLATDRQNLIMAQSTELQDQQTLKNAISKDPLSPTLLNVEIIPTELPNTASAEAVPTFEQAIQQAFLKRPDLLEQAINVKNSDVDVHATKNALLPTLTLSAQYAPSGLAGNSVLAGTPIVTAGAPIVGANGQPITVPGAGGVPVEIFSPLVSSPAVGTQQQGLGTANSQIFHNTYPDYNVSLNLELPLRNRSAQADNQHAVLFERQMQTQLQQMKNAALLDVRNTYIALEQDRARVQAASDASELQRQTFEAEQKKYQLGASTVYNVILTQRDYVTAQGTQLRALADLVEAKANYERAIGITLDVNRVTIADAQHGEVGHDTLIPGTLHGYVVGTQDWLANTQKPRDRDPSSTQ